MQPATASAQVPVNHHLAQTLPVSAYSRLADSAHCFKGLQRTVASKCTVLSSDQLPRQASFSCSLKVNIYFSFLLLLILASLRHSTFRLTKPVKIQIICLGRWQQSMASKHERDFQLSSSPGLGARLDTLWVLLSLKILPTELTEVKGFCTSCSESSPAKCVQQQRYCIYSRSICSHVSSNIGAHTYIKQVNLMNQRAGINILAL